MMQEVKIFSGTQEDLEDHDGRENQVAEQSNGKVLRADF